MTAISNRDLELMRGNTVIGLELRDSDLSALRLYYEQGGTLAIVAERGTLKVDNPHGQPFPRLRILEVERAPGEHRLVVRFEDDAELVVRGVNLEIVDHTSIP